MLYRCPHCREPAIARRARNVTPLLFEVHYQCPDPECGHSFEVQAEVLHAIKPSARPDPAICIPPSPHVRRTVVEDAA